MTHQTNPDELRKVVEHFENVMPTIATGHYRFTDDEVLDFCKLVSAAKKLLEIQPSTPADIDSLVRDKERLDWLSEQAWTNREGECEIHYDFKGDLRQAIDIAMPPKKCPKCKSKKINWSSEDSDYFCHACNHHF